MDVETIAPKQAIAELKGLVASRGWAVFVQLVQNAGMDALNALSAIKRPEGVTDDYLRGRIAAFKETIAGPKKAITEFDASQAAEKTQREMEAVGSPYRETADDEKGGDQLPDKD